MTLSALSGDNTDQLMVVDRSNTFLGVMALSSLVLNLAIEPEGFGRTTVEALSLGIPVIGYRHSGTEEILSRILPEGLVETRNRDELLTRTLSFLQCPPAVPHAHPYTLRTMLDAEMALYEQLASGEPA